jgi:uncharacterized Zn-binding protein involved in type VI secretion
VDDAIAHIGGKGAVISGSPNVRVGGAALARMGDSVQHNKGFEKIVEGEPTVLINRMPAARVGDRVACEGRIAVGCTSVRIGKHALGECVRQAGESGAAIVSG